MQWGMQYAVGTQYAVAVDAKRSTHTVYFLHQHLLHTASPHCVGSDLFALEVTILRFSFSITIQGQFSDHPYLLSPQCELTFLH